MSLVYLLHFTTPYKHAKHYLGFAESNLEQRLARHRSGDGAKLLRAVMNAGGDFVVARVWNDADRHFERRLKRRKYSPRLCPLCKAAKAARR